MGLQRTVRGALGKGMLLATIATLAVAAAAHSAEVIAAEVEGTANHVTVEQGGSATFTVEVRASGNIRCATSPDDPATAGFDPDISIGADGSIGAGGPLAVASFYAIPGTAPCRVTWPGDPTSQQLELTVTADLETPLGDHVYWPRVVLFTPFGSGDRLEDRTRTMLTFTVVPGSDLTPPTVACAGPNGQPGDNGWYVSAVAYACEASDDGSGLADPADASFTLSTSDEGTTWTDARIVPDGAGNETSAGPHGPHNVDLEDPAVHISVPALGEVFLLGQEATASFACSDGASGVASCQGGSLDTATPGWKTFTVQASDHAGRSSSVSHEYQVVYAFAWSGPMKGTAKAGSAVPLRWTLGGVADVGSFVAADSIPCGGGASEPAATLGPSYAAGNDTFHLVLKSDKDWRGTCRTLRAHLSDGSVHGTDVTFT